MSAGKAYDTFAAGVAIAGVVLTALVRVTPFSWFPWDLLVALGVLGLGLLLVALNSNSLKNLRAAPVVDSAHEIKLDAPSKGVPSNPTVETDARKSGARGSP